MPRAAETSDIKLETIFVTSNTSIIYCIVEKLFWWISLLSCVLKIGHRLSNLGGHGHQVYSPHYVFACCIITLFVTMLSFLPVIGLIVNSWFWGCTLLLVMFKTATLGTPPSNYLVEYCHLLTHKKSRRNFEHF